MSTTESQQLEGWIDVRVASDSVFFGSHAPIEVRDGSLRLVKEADPYEMLKVPVGLYEVSAVLGDGQRHSRLVQVRDNETARVDLGQATAEPMSGVEPEPPAANIQRAVFTRQYQERLLAGNEPGVESPFEFLEARGAEMVRQTRTLWLFECAPDLDEVASADFRIAGERISVSLPISPSGPTPSGICAVRIEEDRHGQHAQAWISPERTVANSMQNMLASGFLLEAADIANDAIELLRDKYQDPVGAALGALILGKVGRLRDYQSWLENLARDFAWLPDGKILLAALLFKDFETQERAIELTLAASLQRVLYSETYSLLLDVIRRWPRDSYREERRGVLDALAETTPYVDWEAICLSHGYGEEAGGGEGE